MMGVRRLFGGSILFALLLSLPIVAGPNDIAAEAEVAYKARQYQVALDHYETLLDDYPRAPDLLYNLGNTYLKLAQVGKAITYYERALKYAPLDGAIRKNLDIARQRLVDDIKPDQRSLFQDRVLNRLSLNTYLILFLLLFSAFSLLLFLMLIGKGTDVLKMLTIGVVVGMVLFAVPFWMKVQADIRQPGAVIISKKVEVRSGPSAQMPTLFFIHEGSRFQVLKSIDAWTQIRLPNGYEGWILQEEFWTI